MQPVLDARPRLSFPPRSVAADRTGGPISLVVPCFNEQDRIAATIETLSCPSSLPSAVTEILFVDDGSTDRTPELLDAAASLPRMTVLRLPRNSGKGAAVRAGLAASTGAVVVFMDADLATDLDDLPALVAALDEVPVAIGSRALPGSAVFDAPTSRGVMGRTFNRLVRAITGLPYRDTQCGFKAFRRDAAEELLGTCQTDGFGFDVEILLRADASGHRVHEVPVRWTAVPGSRINPVRDSIGMVVQVVRARRSVSRRT